MQLDRDLIPGLVLIVALILDLIPGQIVAPILDLILVPIPDLIVALILGPGVDACYA